MSQRFYGDRLKRAVHLLLFRRGRIPGAKDWELKARLGKDHQEVIAQLNQLLSDFDLEIKKASEEASSAAETTGFSKGDEQRYLVTLKGNLTLSEARACGWRIDNLAALSICLSYIISHQGRAPRSEIEKLIAAKLGRWKALSLLDAFIRQGYVSENDDDTVQLGWRAKAEVDFRKLLTLLAESKS